MIEKENTLAATYALALFELAANIQEAEAWQRELKTIEADLKENQELADVLLSAAIDTEIKKNILKEIYQTKMAEKPFNFICFLLDKERFAYLSQIINSFGLKIGEAKGVKAVYVQTATELNEEEIDTITKTLEAKLAAPIYLKIRTNPKLIGGIKVQVGDKVYDASIKNQLEKLKEDLKK